jgi:hypothetical protein
MDSFQISNFFSVCDGCGERSKTVNFLCKVDTRILVLKTSPAMELMRLFSPVSTTNPNCCFYHIPALENPSLLGLLVGFTSRRGMAQDLPQIVRVTSQHDKLASKSSLF